ncbi:MAG: hypothetical protein QXN42_08035 [Ignisphaera sp.]
MLSKEDLEAYLKLRNHGKPVTVRGFQRLMGYKSPGKAQRVLDRLVRLGFAERVGTEYKARDDLLPQLAMYTIIKGFIVPRILVYAVYSTVTVAVYAILSTPPLYLIILLTSIVVPYWLETIKLYNALNTLLKKAEQFI